MAIRTLPAKRGAPVTVLPPAVPEGDELATEGMPAPVTSSVLRGVCYDIDLATLDIVFRSGAVYRYAGVPPRVAGELLEAASKGKYFNRFVRGRYLHKRVR
jgi:hypothetical protein